MCLPNSEICHSHTQPRACDPSQRVSIHFSHRAAHRQGEKQTHGVGRGHSMSVQEHKDNTGTATGLDRSTNWQGLKCCQYSQGPPGQLGREILTPAWLTPSVQLSKLSHSSHWVSFPIHSTTTKALHQACDSSSSKSKTGHRHRDATTLFPPSTAETTCPITWLTPAF